MRTQGDPNYPSVADFIDWLREKHKVTDRTAPSGDFYFRREAGKPFPLISIVREWSDPEARERVITVEKVLSICRDLEIDPQGFCSEYGLHNVQP